jgi:hypothetical protein
MGQPARFAASKTAVVELAGELAALSATAAEQMLVTANAKCRFKTAAA